MTIKYFLFFTYYFLIFNKIMAQPEEVEGNWHAKELDESVITIKENGKGEMVGFVKSSDNAQTIGKQILFGFKYDKGEDAYKGKIYSYKRKMELDGTLKLDSNGILKVTGKKLFISKTFPWKRLEE